MTDFTREQLARITQKFSAVGEYYTDDERDLADFALALLDRVDEWEKVFGHIDKDPDTAGNKIIEARREIEAERDRLREENKSLREANEIDLGEKAPLIFENAELKARNEILREELREVLRDAGRVMGLLAEHGASILPHLMDDDENPGERLRQAVRRARERTEINKEQEDK